MDAEIDRSKFEQMSGDLRFLPLVASGFLQQLPQWYVEFASAIAAQNKEDTLALLHKIKGSCYAVAAYGAVDVLKQAEKAYALGNPLVTSELLSRVASVATELRVIVAHA